MLILILVYSFEHFLVNFSMSLFGSYLVAKGIAEYTGHFPNYPYLSEAIKRKMFWRFIRQQKYPFYIFTASIIFFVVLSLYVNKNIKFKGSKKSLNSYQPRTSIMPNKNKKLEGKCGIAGCNEPHRNHYCRLCGNKRSTHLAKYCPTGVDLWHGTQICNLTLIAKYQGLKASKSGRFGQGVYFADTKHVAECIAKNR